MHPFNPAIDLILQSGFSLFSKVSVMMLGLIGTIFLMRVIALQARFAHAEDYATLLKDVVLYFAMIQLFPILVRMIYSTGAGLATKISFVPVTVAQSKLDDFFSSMFFDFQILKITAKIGDFVILNLAQGFYSIFTALLLSIAPIFIFMSTILGFEKGLGFYFTTIISISLWPVVWNLIGLFGKELFNSTDSSTLTIIIYWFLIQLLQLLSPLFCLFLLKSLSPSGVVTKIIGMGSKIGGKL
jgi:hypothetical protein